MIPTSMPSRVAMTGLLLTFAAGIAGASAQHAGEGGQRPGRFDPNEAFITAAGLQADGNCAGAIPIYYRLAFRGGGFEESQHRLGQCLILEAGNKQASTNYLAGLVWHRRAAEAGWPEAQASLILAYLEGPESLRDPLEAAMWLAVYKVNPGRKQVGFKALPEETMARLEARLSPDQGAEGERRARDWHITYWKPPRVVPRRQPPPDPGAEGDHPQAQRGDGRGGGRGGGRKGRRRRPRASAGP